MSEGMVMVGFEERGENVIQCLAESESRFTREVCCDCLTVFIIYLN